MLVDAVLLVRETVTLTTTVLQDSGVEAIIAGTSGLWMIQSLTAVTEDTERFLGFYWENK